MDRKATPSLTPRFSGVYKRVVEQICFKSFARKLSIFAFYPVRLDCYPPTAFHPTMKRFVPWTLLAAMLSLSPLHAQTNATPPAPAPSQADQEKKTLEKHTRPILDALNLNSAEKEAKVRSTLAEYLKALNTWHATNDAQIKSLWSEFSKARTKQDQAGANAALAKIDGVYASFKPDHQKFLAGLSSVLTPEQVETVKDTLTVNKVHVTFKNYGEIFHGLTGEQKAFILKNLKAAREEAIDASAMKEKSAFFKKYKIKIEAYLTAQGYDVKQSYKDFVAKQKAEAPEKKAAGDDE